MGDGGGRAGAAGDHPPVPKMLPLRPRAGTSSEEAQSIIVTGSRLARSTFDSPQPVTVLGGEEFERLQITNVGEGISELPSFRPSTNPSTNGFGSFNVGAQIVNLRGIGVTRNLVLVDGRRFAPTTREGSVDLNFIPSILVARTEVVTGGASAAYGSDALAGVVNVILDTKLEGFKGQIDQGISEEGDARNFHAAFAYGTPFGGGNGHFVIGGEYSDQKGAGNCFTRDYCKVGAVVANPGFATNGMPNFVRSDDNGGFFINNGGVINGINNGLVGGATPTPAQALQNARITRIRNLFGVGGVTFAPNGSVLGAQQGTVGSGLSQIGGAIIPTYVDSDLIAPVERYTVFAHADYELSDTIRGFLEGSYGHVDGGTFQAAYFNASVPIFADNPFIPALIRAQLDPGQTTQPTAPYSLNRPAAATAFSMGRLLDDVGRAFSRSKADTYRATAGLSGEFGSGFEWDTYYQYGRTDRLQTVANQLVLGDPANSVNSPATIAKSNANFFFAADAVVDPATGQATCRALLSPDPALRAAAAGCVPINLFGPGNVSPAGRDYIYDTLVEDIKLQQHVVAANVRGSLADLWAGSLAVAAGGEYRVDKIDVVHDALSNKFAYFQNFGADFNGKTEVVEGYLEAELPLISDQSWTKSLTINGAVRQAHYKVSGFGSYLRTSASNSFDATTWKVSVNWQPVDWLRLRGTQSRDVRAPNFAELFLASASSFTPVLNRFNNNASNTPSIVNGGSPTAKPEKADTTTLGIVFTPQGFLDGLRVSADFYDIKINDYLGQPPGGAQFIVDRCFAGVADACALINQGAGITTGQTITEIRNIVSNLDEIRTKGVDIEADYRIRLAGDDSLLLRAIATYVDELTTRSFGDVVDRAGQTGGSAAQAAPHWTANGTVTYSTPQASITLQGRYIDSGLYDVQRIGPDDPRYATTLPNSISDNKVDSRFYVNLFASIFVGDDKRFEFFGSVNNLFNKAPPAAPETAFYTNPVYFDTIGRYFRFGGRVKF